MTTSTKTLSLTDYSTYIWAAVFTAANILLPELCHSVNLGGKALMPIMLFTLIAAARLGLPCAILTAVASPLVSMLIFGMPSGIMTLVVVLKSLLIAGVIGGWQYKVGKFSLLNIIMLVIGYQLIGFAYEGALFFGYQVAWADLLISWPGALIQMLVLWAITRKRN